MSKNKNFLLGYGERLTKKVGPPPMKPNKSHPYTFEESIERLDKPLSSAIAKIKSLPNEACPDDQAVAVVTLHPAYLAKSYFPEDLLRTFDLKAVGSRPKEMIPEKVTTKADPTEVPSVELFVAGKRNSFEEWHQALHDGPFKKVPGWGEDLIKLENIRYFENRERIRPLPNKKNGEEILLEVALHASDTEDANFVLWGFKDYLKKLGVAVDLQKRIHAQGLCFMPVVSPKELVEQIEAFSFLRVLREMPRLRSFSPVLRISPDAKPFAVELPEDGPLDPQIKVAVFDGGLPPNSPVAPWVNRKKSGRTLREPKLEYLDHGLAVTSALLFGPLQKRQKVERPFATVDHFRILDDNTDPQSDLFDVLSRITDVLSTGKYEFANLSLGPHLPIEDNEVHVWTAKLDEILADGKILATVAVGNDGNADRESGNARIQVPSDCVNALSIGASDSRGKQWRRAPYSSVGPGRAPGFC